ncbi:MAG: YraN family protein [Acidobacteriota bacterium]
MTSRDFRRQPDTRAQGRLSEATAVDWLRRQGYQITERNVTSRVGEIDVVARDGDTLCFVEIKARSTHTYGSAIESISPQKQRRIARAAALYLARKPFAGPCRFDVLAMDLGERGWRFDLVRDAFSVPG